MLDLVARHGAMDLQIVAKGDLDVDQHHTVEDLGIALGEAVTQGAGLEARHPARGVFPDAHGRNAGVGGHRLQRTRALRLPMALYGAAVGDLQTELVEDFFRGFAQAAAANVHLRLVYGRSSHHQVEAIFKAFARALRFAATRDPQLKRVLPSTKGLL